MSNALRNAVKQVNETPQTKQARTDQVVNNAGGFVFEVSDKARLERFLILGTDGGTYYVGEQKLTDDNIAFLRKLISTDERLVVDTAVDVSVNARAYRNSPAIFAIALVLTEGKDKAYAREAFNKVVRTSTHLFEAAEYIDKLGGWGRAKRAAFAAWYESKDADALAYQAVKYRQRNGWTHRDVLRLSHAKPDANVANFMVGKDFTQGETANLLYDFTRMQAQTSVEGVLSILDENKNLPWETIPTEFLKDADVWKKLFYNNQLNGQALVRNVTRLAKIDAFKDVKFAGDYAKRLADKEMIAKTKLHPINFLNALGVYTNGQLSSQGGYYGSRNKTWNTNPKIAGALEAGFYGSFKNVNPSNKRHLLAIDTSGSMTWHGPAGLVGLDCREAAAAMAMITVRTEPYVDVIGFGTNVQHAGISDTDSLAEVQRKIDRLPAAGTNLALPVEYARKNKLEFDTFVDYTDNETWAGHIHPFQALKKYRNEMDIEARLAVVGFVSTPFSIADPNDRGSMDFVGFDANGPAVMADFSAGRI